MIISNLEQLTTWIQPGNVGNDGGGSAAPAGVFTMTPGSTAVFSAKPAAAYNNGYFYTSLPGALGAMTYFEYRLRFMLPTMADIAACQAVEFELQQNVGSHIYNMAWQMDLKGSGVWRSFNYNTSSWEPTAIKVPSLIPGQWVDVMANFLRGGGAELTHLTLRVDGVITPVNVTREATAKVEGDYLHAAFQLDSNSSGAAFECEAVDMSVTMFATTN